MVLNFFIGVIATLHLYFLWFEMFAWTTKGKKIFKTLPPEIFEPTKPMAANQGLYNGFLAAGLLWTFFIKDPIWKADISIFFLVCVLSAGIYGAITIDRKIFFVQAVPAIISLLLVFLG